VLKYLLLVAVIVVALGYVIARSRSRRDEVGQARAPHATIRCERCGIYVPQESAIRVGGRDYCCAEHGRGP